MNDRPTPETDALEQKQLSEGCPQWNDMMRRVREHAALARKLERQRDEAREKAERYRLEANAMMLQRDELKKIVEQRILVGAEIHAKANAMDDYLANKQTNNHPLYGGDSLL